jgi:hypothetical protein
MTGNDRQDVDARFCDLLMRKPVWKVADALRSLMKGERRADGSA